MVLVPFVGLAEQRLGAASTQPLTGPTTMRKPRVIGLIGLKQAGKDYAADHLRDSQGYQIYKYAWALKECCKAVFGWSDAEVNDSNLKERIDPYWGISPRWAQQVVGTELFRNRLTELVKKVSPKLGRQFEGVWVRSLERRWENAGRPDIVISDLRFPNELEFVRKYGGKIILIVNERQEIPRLEDCEHASERLALECLHDIQKAARTEVIDAAVYNNMDSNYLQSLDVTLASLGLQE